METNHKSPSLKLQFVLYHSLQSLPNLFNKSEEKSPLIRKKTDGKGFQILSFNNARWLQDSFHLAHQLGQE